MLVDKRGRIECGDPAHRGWTVWRDGYYGRAPRRRQRYRCFDPKAPETRTHKFTPKVMRLESIDTHCLDCESPLAVGQGPNAARRYDFAAREVAAALVALAHGATYSQAALTARRSVFDLARHWPDAYRGYEERAQPGQAGNESSSHGTLVASWVEAYTDVVLDGPEAVEMPQVLMLDSTTFTRRFHGRRVPAFSVLCAYGYQEGAKDGRLLRAVAYRTASGPTWEDFLSQMSGMPEVVISDRGQEIIGGVNARWPKPGAGNRPEKVFCRWHMAKNLRAALATDIKPHLSDSGLKDATQHPLWQLAERAFDDETAWTNYYRVAYRSLLMFDPDSLDMPDGLRWLNTNNLLVRSQMARRAERPGPESTGPLEAHIREIRRTFAYRAQSLRNRPRTNQLLRLIVAGRNGEADERVWTERIRRHLTEHAGVGPRQRQLVGSGGL